MQPIHLRRFLLHSLATVLVAPPALASTLSYTGNLRTDANVTACGPSCTLGPGDSDADYAQYAAVVRSFTVGSAATLTATTFSYGGGVNGSGATVAQGGFQPYLSLFDSTGAFVASTYFGTTCPTGARANPLSGQCDDVALNTGILTPGSYSIAISAFENLSLAENYGSGTLADGFTGLGTLQDGEDLHFAFDVDLTPATPPPPPPSVPEPGALSLLSLGLAGVRLISSHRAGEHRRR